MEQSSDRRTAFEAEVIDRFGILPNLFRSARAAPELIQKLWSFAKSGYLDNPIPALFKERLFHSVAAIPRALLHRAARRLSSRQRPAGRRRTRTHTSHCRCCPAPETTNAMEPRHAFTLCPS